MYDAQTSNTGDFQTVRIESRPQILTGNIIDRPGAHLSKNRWVGDRVTCRNL